MNGLQNNIAIRSTYPQEINTTNTNTASNVANNGQVETADDAPRMIKQDSSDVLRQGSSGRLKAEKKMQKDAAKKLARSMQGKRKSQAQEVEKAFLDRLEKFRNHDPNQNNDLYEDYARESAKNLLDEYRGNGFSAAEQLALLSELQDNNVIKHDVILKKTLQNAIDDIYTSSTSAQMALHSVDFDSNAAKLFGSADAARAAADALLLNYSNQASFLEQAKEFFGEKKFKEEFPEICSHFMTKLTSFISSMTNTSGMEKAGLQSALEGISSLQQMQGVYYAADALTSRMEQRYAA